MIVLKKQKAFFGKKAGTAYKDHVLNHHFRNKMEILNINSLNISKTLLKPAPVFNSIL